MEGTVRVAVVGVPPFQEELLLVVVLQDIHLKKEMKYLKKGLNHGSI